MNNRKVSNKHFSFSVESLPSLNTSNFPPQGFYWVKILKATLFSNPNNNSEYIVTEFETTSPLSGANFLQYYTISHSDYWPEKAGKAKLKELLEACHISFFDSKESLNEIVGREIYGEITHNFSKGKKHVDFKIISSNDFLPTSFDDLPDELDKYQVNI